MSPQHKPELDGIRGMAILGVLLAHSWPYIKTSVATNKLLYIVIVGMTFGQWGVDLFFALSGFLITGILIDTKRATNYFSSFYARRALRILPIYYGSVAVLFSLSLFIPWVAQNAPPPSEWPAYIVYLQNVPLFWQPGHIAATTMAGHFWSLAVEEQFYLVWPFIVFFLPRRIILWICVAGCVLALPLRIFLQQHVFGMSWTAMIITTARIDGLFVGAACAILVRRSRLFPVRIIVLLGGVGFLLLGWIAAFHRRGEFFGAGAYMRTFGVTAVALLSGALIGLSQRHSLVKGFFTARWLRFFGRYAYGLYVFHVPVYIVAATLVGPKLGFVPPLPLAQAIPFILIINVISVGVAVASFEFFEAKILQLKDRFRAKLPKAESSGGEIPRLTDPVTVTI
jgi:peptidoglycan/LPS O-acetylase OafA/YrhL